MLGVEEKTVYDILASLAGDTEVYKIIDADEVIENLPEGVSLTRIQLSAIIRELKDKEYVDIKYFTPEEYCLQIVRRVELPAGQQGGGQAAQFDDKRERVLYGSKNDTTAPQASVKKGAIFWMAFLGAFLGSAIVATVAALIIKFV